MGQIYIGRWASFTSVATIKQDPAACMAVLTQAQAAGRITFRQQRSSEGDCPLDNPVRVTRFGPVALSASFLASCPLALSSTMFVGQAAAPEAQTLLGKRLVRIDHVGSFACRNIYHRAEGRRSEHASADALDVAAFRFGDGSRLTIGGDYRRQNDGGQYLRTLFSASCAYYGNALGPDYIAKKLNYGYTDFMSYSIDFRRRILSIKKHEGLSIRETAKRFHIGTTTIVRWTKQIDARPATSRQRKIDKSALERDVEQYPDAYQRERAERFGVCQMAICKALKKLQLTYKKNSASSKSRRRR